MRYKSRGAHWIALNHQCRIPKRWITFDTESKRTKTRDGEEQTWALGTGILWHYKKGVIDRVEKRAFDSPMELWEWVTAFCRTEERTVVVAHNLSHDVRIADAMGILPGLGWKLEWCNLDRNVSSMTWRSNRGTLVFADSFTWLPMPLSDIGSLVGLPKLSTPTSASSTADWSRYCMRDSEIVFEAMKAIIQFIRDNDLGNWQPTGAGMAYATWRHKFMTHHVLVHDDRGALAAEREAMHTGRAEAWRHGTLTGKTWVELDMKDAYVRVAAECDMPEKMRYHSGPITPYQYRQLRQKFRVLARVHVKTTEPMVPCRHEGRIIWPVGEFETWLWDPEIDLLMEDGQAMSIREVYIYTRAPVLAEWAKWTMGVAHGEDETAPAVVRKWAKHCGRALIGRLSLRSANWEVFGDNPLGEVGITHAVDVTTGQVSRQMHVGTQTFLEKDRTEGRDSVPQITGYIMSESRARLWRAMRTAGFEEIAHVDTDGMLVTTRGAERIVSQGSGGLDGIWQVKGRFTRVAVYAPRNYRTGRVRKVAGIPVKATEVAENRFTGERWSSMATDMAAGRMGSVSVLSAEWLADMKDPRRDDSPGGGTWTVPRQLDGYSSSAKPSSATADDGL